MLCVHVLFSESTVYFWRKWITCLHIVFGWAVCLWKDRSFNVVHSCRFGWLTRALAPHSKLEATFLFALFALCAFIWTLNRILNLQISNWMSSSTELSLGHWELATVKLRMMRSGLNARRLCLALFLGQRSESTTLVLQLVLNQHVYDYAIHMTKI